MATNKNFVVKNGLEVDGNTLYVDADNNRVGVNTSTPGYDFDVNGTVRFVGNVNLDSELVIDNTNSKGITVTGGVGDTYPHITLGGGGPQTIKFLDVSDSQGLELVYRTSPDELKIEKGSAYTLFSAGRDTGAIKLYYGNALKFETTASGVTATGNITLTGNAYFADNQSARFGASGDLQIYHENTFNNSVIVETGTGNLLFGGNNIDFRDSTLNEIYATFSANGAVSLRYDNVVRFETTATGISVVGDINLDDNESLYLGTSNDLRIYHDGTHSWIWEQGPGNLYLRSNGGSINLRLNSTDMVVVNELGSVDLYFNNFKKFETSTTGVTVTGTALATQLSTGATGTGINITTNTISGPSTLTLDPAGVGDNTGTVVIAGNLQVDGTTTTINSTTVAIDDLNLTLASGAANASAANGAGITIDGANASLTYVSAKDSLNFNKNVVIGNDDNGGHASYVSSAALRVDGDAGVGLFVTGNAQNADPVAVFYKNDDANNVPAVIISSDADNGQESILDVRGRVTANTSDLSATSNSVDTIFDVRGDKNVYVTGNIYAGGRYGQTNYKVLTTADEGSGNGIDADTVDGIQADSFLRSDADDSASGNLTFSGQLTFNRYGNTHFSYGANNDIYLTYGSTGGIFARTWNGTGYSTRFTLDSNGNLGLGVTPTQKLHVSGNALVTGNITNGGFDFILGNSDQSTRGNSGSSRALVKDTGNILSINHAGDFTGGTRINSTLTVVGSISTNTGYITANTASGYIQIGPANTSFAHITTNLSKFYFNRPITVDDTLSSYNADLLLYANNFGTLGVSVTNGGATTLYHNSSAKLATTSTGISVTGDTSSTTFSTAGGMVITGGPGTIAGATFNNGWLRIGTSSQGWTFDNNEFFTAGPCIFGSLAGSSLTFSNIPAFNGGTSGSTAPFTVDSTFLVTNLNADLLDNLHASSFLRSDANNDSASGTFRTSGGYIEAGLGSGSVALTINDGYGNANIAFNHRAGVPDVTGSSGRIVCDVDSATAKLAFYLKNSTTANTAVGLTQVMSMVETGVTIPGTLGVSGTTTLGAQTWGGHITWNTGQNIYISGESSFDLQTGGRWALYDASTSNTWVTVDNGQPMYFNNNARSIIVNTASGSDVFQVRHRTDTDISMSFYCESGTAQIADTFTDTTTDKKYIYFSNPNGSNDPGYIMHETSNLTSPDERNEGVLHLAPSDDNGYGDYVSIHGTNRPDCLKLHTDGTIETASGYTLKLSTATGSVTIPDGNTSYGLGSLPSLILGVDGSKAGTVKLLGGTAGQYSLLQHTTNNLHIDSTGSIYLAHYDDGMVYVGNTGGTGDSRLAIYKADNNVSDHLQFYVGTTRIGEIGGEDTAWLRINQETNVNIYTPRYIRADNGFYVDGTTKGIDGSGNFIGGTVLSPTGGQFERPSNLWSSAWYGVSSSLGGLYTEGSYRVTLTSNGYRNSSNTWTSLGANANTGAATVSLDPTGIIYFGAESAKANGSSSTVTTKAYIDKDGFGTDYTIVANASNANQILVHPGSSNVPTVIHRNDGADYYMLISAAGTSPSGTWNGLRPFRINLTNGQLYSGNSQYFSGGLTSTGNITVSKSLPKLILDSPSAGADFTEQGAQISLGESGDGGSAALHLTYVGNGYSYLGMGTLNTTTGIPANYAMRFYYTNNGIYMPGELTIDGNITTSTNLMYIGVDNNNTTANSTLGFRTDGSVRATLTNDDFAVWDNLNVGRINVNNAITYNTGENSITLYGGASNHYIQLTGRSGTANDNSLRVVVGGATKFQVNENGKLGVGAAPNTGYLAHFFSPSTATGDSGLYINLDGWANNTAEYGINLDIDSTSTDNITADRSQFGIGNSFDTYVPQNASTTAGTRFLIYGIYNNLVANDNPDVAYTSGRTHLAYACYNRARHDAAGGANDVRGCYNLVQAGGNTNATANTWSNGFGTYNYVINSSAQTTITYAYGTYNWINQDVAGGAVTNAYGSYNRLDHDAGTAGTGYLFRGTYEGTWTTKWGIYLTGETNNYLNGNLGIGTTTISEKLHVSGNILATGNITAYSDSKLKDNVKTIENALNKVTKLRGVEFNRNDIDGNPKQIGVIAQEVENIIPEVVTYHEKTDIKSVAYGNMVGLLIEAIKEQQTQIESLKNEIKSLKENK